MEAMPPSVPAEEDMSQWTKFGGGHLSESYIHADGKTMMKLYFDFVRRDFIERELRVAEAAYAMGISTPKPGETVRCGERLGNTFACIADKRSFARAIADEPGKMKEYAERFAAMAKKLHETPADASLVPSYREKLTALIRQQTLLSTKEKKTLLRFLNSVEDTGTCLHGDLHIGNVVTDGTTDYFIDVGDLSYGNPLFDLGGFYIMSHVITDADCRETYHISLAQHQMFWAFFLREYFGADTPDKLVEADRRAKLFAAFQALVYLDYDPSCTDFLRFVQKMIPEIKEQTV